ncbi:MAG TPA: hypothetical protein IAD08_05270 [Candidatus Scatovivens faecipullorum]|nr:hypothetical protein [Candidatus Scatovivens faecipullorum]
MDSYELLQDLDKKHGRTSDYTITVTPSDISEVTKNVTKERRDSAKKSIAAILNSQNKENSEKTNTALKIEEIVVNEEEKGIDESSKDGDER